MWEPIRMFGKTLITNALTVAMKFQKKKPVAPNADNQEPGMKCNYDAHKKAKFG